MRYNRGLLVLCAAVAIAVTLHGCGAKETMPEETQRQTEETQIHPVTSAPAAEASPEGEPLKTGNVHLTVSQLALAYPGRTEDIYCGTAPREEIVWASGAPDIISVENGVVSALSEGEAEITAVYGDQQASCTVVCLAESVQAWKALDNRTLSQSVREPPVPAEGPCTYFDDAGFVGDSVTYQLLYTQGRKERIGSPVELFRRSASVKGFTDYYWNLVFRGQEQKLEDAVAESGVKKLFIMLGSNDMGFVTVEDTMKNWDILIDRIWEKSPEVEIYIESILPSATGDRNYNGKNEKISQYNRALKDFAQEKGLHYIEIGGYFEDSLGRLAAGYSSDGDVHITENAVYRWSDILRLFAQRQEE